MLDWTNVTLISRQCQIANWQKCQMFRTARGGGQNGLLCDLDTSGPTWRVCSTGRHMTRLLVPGLKCLGSNRHPSQNLMILSAISGSRR
jgi:hypothetical protein